jgi:hypothetical protein|tara:strand:+ start:369 stop:1355 length:987 start_codon:yes stop_codon:yes gene_type:complete
MANATVSRLGLVNNTGTDFDALFLKTFSGEILTSFAENNIFNESMHTVRSIASGKSAQFPVLGTATAAYHTVGTPLVGANQIKANEKIINIDDLLISQAFVADIDSLKNHYDVRQTYSSELGKALARTYDQNVAKVIANASRASTTLSGGNGGVVLTLASGNTASANVTGDELAAAIYDIAQTFDERDIPTTDRFVVLPPAEYYKLAESATRTIDVDFNPGGNGSFASGRVQQIAGMPVMMSNNVPQSNVGSNPSGANNTYSGDDSKTIGLVFHKSAVGTVKLMDMTTEISGSDYNLMYQGTLMVAKYALGHGILRPEAAATIKLSAS